MTDEYTFKKYQEESKKTARYPSIGHKVIYPVLGLNGEVGEVTEKIKKIFRNQDGEFSKEDKISIKKELGDILWYLAQIATELELSLEDVALENIIKINSRLARGVIESTGDDR